MTLVTALFALSAFSITLIVCLSIASLKFVGLHFFPPPEKGSWQYVTFWTLFRLLFFGLVALSILDFESVTHANFTLRMYVALPVLILGFGLAFYLSYFLGWKNAHGQACGLVTSGWYSVSRNPVYVVSILGMIGWAVFVGSFHVSILLVLWATLYIVAPFVEEPWLLKTYGIEYRTYQSEVPRFFGFRNLIQKLTK